MILSLVLLLLFCLVVPPSGAQQGTLSDLSNSTQEDRVTDEQVLASWEKLDPDQRELVLEHFRSEVAGLKTFQNTLLQFVLDSQTQDPGLWPMLELPTAYDPALHAPAEPIKRFPMPAASGLFKYIRIKFTSSLPRRKLDSAWVYDYGTRQIWRIGARGQLDRVFRNALNGFPPDLDLAEAIVEQQLDDGSQQEAARAFGHAYTDRGGGVYRELTLYDAWASGAKIEMPDVDVLGIVHDLDGDWDTFKAPLNHQDTEALYARVETLFVTYHQHRGLRHALARNFLLGCPVLRDGYALHADHFHSLWDQSNSTPAKLLTRLPNAIQWKGFLSGLSGEREKFRGMGLRRRDMLHEDERLVRKKLIDAMVEGGYLAR